jgi:hypothetical protein
VDKQIIQLVLVSQKVPNITGALLSEPKIQSSEQHKIIQREMGDELPQLKLHMEKQIIHLLLLFTRSILTKSS